MKFVAHVADGNIVVSELFLYSSNSLASSGKIHEAPKKWCFALSLFKLTSIHNTSRNHIISLYSRMYDRSLYFELFRMHQPTTCPRKSEESPLIIPGTEAQDSSEYHDPGSLSGGPVQLYIRYMGQDVKQARPITSRPGMSALLALLNCTQL